MLLCFAMCVVLHLYRGAGPRCLIARGSAFWEGCDQLRTFAIERSRGRLNVRSVLCVC